MKNIKEVVRGSDYVSFYFINKMAIGELMFKDDYFRFTRDIKDKNGNVLTGGVGVAAHNDIAHRDASDAHPLTSITGLTDIGDGTLFLANDGTYKATGSGSGDMDKATYDPNSIGGDAFAMSNMLEGAASKVFTNDERNKLIGVESNAQVNVQSDWTSISGDSLILNKPYIPTTAADIAIADANDNYVGEELESVLQEIGNERRVSGFDRENPETMPELSVNNASRTLTVSVKSGSADFQFWAKNKKFSKTSAESIQIPNVDGYGYVVYDNSGVLTYKVYADAAIEDFYEHAIVMLVYWNVALQEGLWGSELHGKVMSPSTHWHKHETVGARYVNGLNIEGLASGVSTYTQQTSGVFRDEDIRHEVAAQQASRVLYKLGASGTWTWSSTPDLSIGYRPSGATYDVYNYYNSTTGEWELSEGDSANDFYIYFDVEFPAIDGGGEMFRIPAQNAYSSRGNARDAIETELGKLQLDGLISPEYVFLRAKIVRRNGNLQSLADGSLYLDLREGRGSVGGVLTSSSFADDIIVDTTDFNNNLSIADTSVQKALDTIDDMTISTTVVTGDVIIEKATILTFAAVQNLIDSTPDNLNGYEIIIRYADGTHNVGDDVLDTTGKYNGRIRHEAATMIGTAGTNQNAIINFDGAGYIKGNNNYINTDFAGIQIALTATGTTVPIQISGNSKITTSLMYWNTDAAAADSSIFYSAGADIASNNDTFNGHGTFDTDFVKFVRGAETVQGGKVDIYNANVGANIFTNAANGVGSAIFSNSDGVFTNKVTGGAVDKSAAGGSSTADIVQITVSQTTDLAQTTATLNATSNRTGHIYWAVLPSASAAPTRDEIVAGTGAVAFDSIVCTANTAITDAITGLSAGTNYSVYAFPTDEDANSGETRSDDFTTISSLPQLNPPVLTLDSVGDTELTISWTQGGNADADIYQHVVRYREVGATTWTWFMGYTGGPNPSPITVTGLTNGVSYEVSVYFEGVSGSTLASEISNIVTATPVGDTVAPTISSITIEDAAPTDVVIVFDEVVTGTNLGFTIGGTTSTTFASISGSGTNTITGVLATAATGGETITLSYDSATGDIADTSGNALVSVTNQAVTNNIAGSSFTISSVDTTNLNDSVDVTLSEGGYGANDGTTPLAASDFIITNFVAGGATAVSIDSITNNTDGALTGGESIIRVNITLTGTPDNTETFEIQPADAASIYTVGGAAMLATETTGSINPIYQLIASNTFLETGTSGQIDVYWVNANTVTTPDSITVRYADEISEYSYTEITGISGSATSYSITGLTDGTAYKIEVIFIGNGTTTVDSSYGADIVWVRPTATSNLTTNMLVNGTFDDTIGWSLGSAWSIASGVLHYDNSASYQSASAQYNTFSNLGFLSTLIPGASYSMTFDVTNSSTGVDLAIRGDDFTNYVNSAIYANGTHTITFTVPTNVTSVYLAFYAYINDVGDIDNVVLTKTS